MDTEGILNDIAESPALHSMWDKYRQQFAYARDIAYEQIIQTLIDLL